MRHQGRITEWKDDKGFGFITPNGGGATLFVHVSALANRQRRPLGGELVTYVVGTDARGRLRAREVAFVGEARVRAAAPGKPRRGLLPTGVTTAFVMVLLFGLMSARLPWVVAALYVVASVVTLFAYTLDKTAARNRAWRTKESTLHVLALVGGWPGALVAQKMLRHKTSKESFQALFWVTVATNFAALVWVTLTPSGAEALRAALDRI